LWATKMKRSSWFLTCMVWSRPASACAKKTKKDPRATNHALELSRPLITCMYEIFPFLHARRNFNNPMPTWHVGQKGPIQSHGCALHLNIDLYTAKKKCFEAQAPCSPLFWFFLNGHFKFQKNIKKIYGCSQLYKLQPYKFLMWNTLYYSLSKKDKLDKI
jgi:hypothetical protein